MTTNGESLSTSLSTLAIHGDDSLNTQTDVAPALHVSTTYRYTNDLDHLNPVNDEDLDPAEHSPVYSRLASPNSTRLETILSKILNGPTLAYSSGCASFFAMLTYLKPKTIAITNGYHGMHGIIDIFEGLYGLKKILVPSTEEEWEASGLGPGDVVHVETPLNPIGEATDLAKIASFVAKRGATLTVDATFGPPPLQDPFAYGARIIMHSGTKYIGGHSDMLCGILTCKDSKDWVELWKQRIFLGSIIGNLEGWLGIRSVRTLEVRVRTQSKNTENLALWLHGCISDESSIPEEERLLVKNCLSNVRHASIQALDPKVKEWLQKQMPNGYGPVFSMTMKDTEMARRLPTKLHFFHHATSLGGVESLIEWRRMSDPGADPKLLRVSVGLESWEDLKSDLLKAMKQVYAEVSGSSTK